MGEAGGKLFLAFGLLCVLRWLDCFLFEGSWLKEEWASLTCQTLSLHPFSLNRDALWV